HSRFSPAVVGHCGASRLARVRPSDRNARREHCARGGLEAEAKSGTEVASGPAWSKRGLLAAVDLGLDGLVHLLHRDLGIGLLALEVGLPDRLADDELLQAE